METPVGNMKCFHPQTINDNVVACGRCYACKKNRINGWVCRLERHTRDVDSANFVTLTYAEGQPTKTNNNLLTLDYTHVQHFFKTLRNLTNADYKKRLKQFNRRVKNKTAIRGEKPPDKPKRFEYYVAGEYGSKNKAAPRPHYHVIMFNARLDLISSAWSTGPAGKRTPRGNIHTGTISGSSIRYTLKYISKPSRIPLFNGDDRSREFSHMSKGIGKNYITPAIIKWHRADLLNRYFIPGKNGVQFTMPRYYANKIYTDAERMEIALHLQVKQAENFYAEILKNEAVIHSYYLIIKGLEAKAFIDSKNNSHI